MTSGSSGAGRSRHGRVVDLIAPAVGEHGQIGRDLRRLGLQEQVVVLAEIGEPLDVAGTEADEGFPSLEFQIDLVAHEAAQPVDLLALVYEPCECGYPTIPRTGTISANDCSAYSVPPCNAKATQPSSSHRARAAVL